MSTNNGENNITCPNCGNTSKENEIEDGCPYCGTNYNIEYSDKSLGTKYHYDRVLQGSNYKTITLVIDIIISAILVTTYIIKTCRTFNIYDISKIIIGTIIVSLILYYLFYDTSNKNIQRCSKQKANEILEKNGINWNR